MVSDLNGLRADRIHINPHLLRTIFIEKCTKAGISEKYIGVFCGRTPKKIIAKYYSDYSSEVIRKQYDLVESWCYDIISLML